MAKILDYKCKLCRRESQKLFLKAERCYTAKCPLEKKGAVTPGFHGQRGRFRLSGFGQQLREKQKLKRIYSVNERQLRRYVDLATRKPGKAGENLIQILELRLDNVIYRLGLAPSRSVARQLVSHRQVQVDGRKVSIPSYLLKPGQIVSLTAKGLEIDSVKKILANKDYRPPAWLQKKAVIGKIERLPEREGVDTEVDEKTIIEFYSR